MYSAVLLVFTFGAAMVASQGTWSPPRQAKMYNLGEPNTIFTRGDKSYREAWYTVQDRTQFVFKVKACSEAYLALASYPEVATDFTIEIALGIEDNTRSQIGYVFEAGGMFNTYTHNLLHCNEYRTFWVRWANAYIEVGRGPVVGEQTFMNTGDAPSHTINSIGLASNLGSAAVWEIRENSGDQMLIFTPDEHKYESMWKSIMERNFFSFSVMASGHVHLVLTEGLGQTSANVVEFVIGGWDNNRTVIRTNIFGNWDSGSTVAEAETKNILNKDEYRDFWIGWMNGTFELGYGTSYGRNRLLRYGDDTTRAIIPRYLSITTGFGATGEWLLQDDQESMDYIYTKTSESDDPLLWYKDIWIESPRKEFITFQVRACEQACILLSDIKEVNPEQSIEIIIGDQGNKKTIFRYLQEIGNIAEADTNGILSCSQTRHFWLSWNNNTIRLGNWHIYDKNVIVEATIGEGYPIRAVSLATPKDDGVWMIRESFGERIEVRTPTQFTDFNQLWRSVTNRDYILFSAKACSDVHVAVAPTPGVERTEAYYDIVISGWDNTKTIIRKVLDGSRSDASAPTNTTGVLHCDQTRDLWVSWTDNIVKVGRGALPNHHVLLDQPLTDIYPIKAVSFSTGFGYSGNIYMDNDNGDYMMYYTNSVINENAIGLSDGITSLVFKLRACSDANVFLRNSGGSENYEIVLGDKTSIKNRNSEVATVDTPNLLSCLDERYYWLNWAVGKVRVGNGSLMGLNSLLEWTDTSNPIDVNLMDFYSRAVDLNCRWKIFYNTARWTSFKTPVDFGYHYIWESVEHRQGLVFNVRACSDVHLILSDIVRQLDRKYEIVIGGWDNTRSVIRMFNVREYTAADTVQINSCNEERTFWITWQNGAIEVGRGEIIGQDRFMDFQPLEFYTVRAVGFSTGYSFNGTWSVKLLDELLQTAPPVTENPGGPDPGSGSGGMSAGAIVGIVIGVLAVVLLGGVAFYMIRNRDSDSPLSNILNRGNTDTTPIAPENMAPEQEQAEINDVEQGSGGASEA